MRTKKSQWLGGFLSCASITRRSAILAALLLAACNSPSTPFPNLPGLSVSTQFSLQNLCDIGVSPEIHLANVPANTASYAVQITNINVLVQTPWRETIAATDKADIPEGAAKTYTGPCLGDMVRFAPVALTGYRHRIEVLAQDADGKPLAYGATVVYVRSAYLVARQQRLQGTAATNVPGATGDSTAAFPPAVTGPFQAPAVQPGLLPGGAPYR